MPAEPVRTGTPRAHARPLRGLPDRGKSGAGALAILAALATGVGYGESHRGRVDRLAPDAVPVAVASPVADPSDSPPIAEFKTFALNVLLIPLLDDGAPLSWTDPFATTTLSLAIDCDAARVSVDGRPLIPSAPVPARAFTLRWHMDRCTILNGSASLTGDVELLVFHDGDRYTASVQPFDLQVQSAAGNEVLRRPFSSSTPLTPWTPP